MLTNENFILDTINELNNENIPDDHEKWSNVNFFKKLIINTNKKSLN